MKTGWQVTCVQQMFFLSNKAASFEMVNLKLDVSYISAKLGQGQKKKTAINAREVLMKFGGPTMYQWRM